MSATSIRFRVVDEFEGWERAPEALADLLLDYPAQRVLEVGAGANPTLSGDFVHKKGIDYTVNDISLHEIQRSTNGFNALTINLASPFLPRTLASQYDFIFSRMVNEHVEDGETYYRNLYAMLRPGGVTAHWFSTLYAFPFLANSMLPEPVADWLLDVFQPRDREKHGKFPARYSWARGPSRAMIDRFREIGFRVIRYDGYFGHTYYRRQMPTLHALEMKKAKWLAKHPIPSLCSHASLVLQRAAY